MFASLSEGIRETSALVQDKIHEMSGKNSPERGIFNHSCDASAGLYDHLDRFHGGKGPASKELGDIQQMFGMQQAVGRMTNQALMATSIMSAIHSLMQSIAGNIKGK